MNALDRAIEIAGGIQKLADGVGVKYQAVHAWRAGARRRVPVSRVLAVEELTGVPRHELRPDIYPIP